MTFKRTLLALFLLPSLGGSLAQACPAHDEQQAMSCAEGSVYDSASGACVPQASS